MARPVDYRKSRGSKGVHTEDEHVPIGKKDQAGTPASNRKTAASKTGKPAPKSKGKHSSGHEGQPPKRAR
jgi:hypothetical protein